MSVIGESPFFHSSSPASPYLISIETEQRVRDRECCRSTSVFYELYSFPHTRQHADYYLNNHTLKHVSYPQVLSNIIIALSVHVYISTGARYNIMVITITSTVVYLRRNPR